MLGKGAGTANSPVRILSQYHQTSKITEFLIRVMLEKTIPVQFKGWIDKGRRLK